MIRLRPRSRAVALVAAAAGGALAVLVLPAAPAFAATVGAQLMFNRVSSSAASGSVITVSEGDTVVFTAGSDTLSVRLHASSLPGGGDVPLSYLGKGYPVSFPVAQTYHFSWTATSLAGRATRDAWVQVIGSAPPPSSSSATSPPPGSSSVPGPTTSSSVGGVSAGRPAGPAGSRAGFSAAPDGGLLALGSSVAGSAAAGGSSTASGQHSSSSAGGVPAAADSTPGAALQADIAHSSTSQPTALAIVSILALAGVLASYAYLYFGRRLTGQH